MIGVLQGFVSHRVDLVKEFFVDSHVDNSHVLTACLSLPCEIIIPQFRDAVNTFSKKSRRMFYHSSNFFIASARVDKPA